jgi:putative ABC transport system permease protein
MFRRRRSSEDFDAEVRSHLELEADELNAEGMPEQEAFRRARVSFGSIAAARERFYERSHVMWLDNLIRDLQFALRSLAKNWRFSSLAILALALGIGSATVIFSAIYGVILNTFPFRDADQVTSFGVQDLSHPENGRREYLTVSELLDYREQTRAFSDISGEYGGFNSTPLVYSAGESTYEFSADFMSINSFGFFGVKPAAGRLPTEDDTKAGATPVFMMSYKLWQQQFGGDPGVLGKSFMLSGVARTLVGIMPPRFRWGWAELWVPFPIDRAQVAADPTLARRWVWCVGRLRPGVSLKAAEADLDVVAHRLAKTHSDGYPKKFTVTATRLSDRVVGPFRSLIYPLLFAVFLLLLIACSNVANLLLVRATTREREMAVRAAIGASRRRLVQQFVMEGVVLAGAGCLLGCALAWLGIRAVIPVIPYNAFPQEAVITLNPVVLACSLAVTLVTTLACSVAPTIRALRGDLQSRLMVANKGSGADARHGKGRAALVVTEVALSIVLLVGAGLMIRTFLALTHVDMGFNPERILAAQLPLPDREFRNAQQRKQFMQQVLARVSQLPGVLAAGESTSTPPHNAGTADFTIPGKTHSENWSTAIDLVDDGYFHALNVPLLRGRLITDEDVEGSRYVAVVNGAFARKFFGQDDPLGQAIQLGSGPDAEPPFKIVGVVSDQKNDGLENPVAPEAFLPFTVSGNDSYGLLVTTAMKPEALLPAIRHAVWTIDPRIAIGDAGALQAILQRDTFANPRFEFIVMGAFAVIGTLLVVIGIYSVMAYTVTLRTHEIGVRMAMGAARGEVLRLMMGRGMLLIATGVGLGLLASFSLTRALSNEVWGISLTDPWTYAAVTVCVTVAGAASCLTPARRAAGVNPAVTLRSE